MAENRCPCRPTSRSGGLPVDQASRTQKRISELLTSREEDSSSDSEEEQDSSPEVNCDPLSAVRRDLYLGVLCLLFLILLLAIWLRSVCLRLSLSFAESKIAIPVCNCSLP